MNGIAGYLIRSRTAAIQFNFISKTLKHLSTKTGFKEFLCTNPRTRFFNVQFYTKCAVLKVFCAVPNKNLCSSKILNKNFNEQKFQDNFCRNTNKSLNGETQKDNKDCAQIKQIPIGKKKL